MDRRNFLKLVGLGSGAVAAAAVPMGGLLKPEERGNVHFQAVLGLPEAPLPAYASYIIEGHIDLSSRTGTVTRALYAGGPDDPVKVALPGTVQLVKVTSVDRRDGSLRISGVVEDRSTLLPGESRAVEISVYSFARKAQANILGHSAELDIVRA